MDNKNKRVLITLFILLVYWIIGCIPVPGIVAPYSFSLLHSFGSNFTIFSLGLMPYITANIIVLLLSAVLPYFKNIVKKEGLNSSKINQTVLGATLILSVIQSIFLSFWMKNLADIGAIPAISLPINIFLLTTSLTITTGVFLILWLGRLISKHGIGNGISLLILLPLIVSGLKRVISVKVHSGQDFLPVLGFIIFLSIIIKYVLGIKKYFNVKTVDDNKISMNIPLSISGFIPLSLAENVFLFLVAISSFTSNTLIISLLQNTLVSWMFFSALVIFFTYFVTALVFNPVQWADRMKQVGLEIPHIESGRSTAKYIDTIMTKFMMKWAGFLIGVFLLWEFFPYWAKNPQLEFNVRGLLFIIGICLAIGESLCLKHPYKKIYVHNDFGEVLIMQALLRAKGIDCMIKYAESYAKYFPFVVGSFGEKWIIVKEDDYEKAKKVVSSLLKKDTY